MVGKYQTLFKPALQQEINISCYETKNSERKKRDYRRNVYTGGGPVGSRNSPLKRF